MPHSFCCCCCLLIFYGDLIVVVTIRILHIFGFILFVWLEALFFAIYKYYFFCYGFLLNFWFQFLFSGARSFRLLLEVVVMLFLVFSFGVSCLKLISNSSVCPLERTSSCVCPLLKRYFIFAF